MKLEFSEISKSYGKTLALQNFSAVLGPGIHALLGPNGSGKSTLMNILTDNLKADSGSILYHGEGVPAESTLAMGERFREKLGFMPQYPGMYPDFTVEDFLNYILVLKDVGRDHKGKEKKTYLSDKVREVLCAVELEEFSYRKIKTLSGGMKQRLALAQAVLGDPEILILDEPTAGLDPKQRIAIRNYISQIALNKIVIIATHVVSDVEFIAKDIILLKKGCIVDMASPQALVGKMNGKVWLVDCKENEVQKMKERFPVINLAPSGITDRPVRLRVLANVIPFENSQSTSPTLEDYYLFLFGKDQL